MLVSLPGIVVGLTVHEYAHAATAYRLGDATAKERGRLSLNPLRHIDPLGFLFLIIAGFGWAKPVSFDRSRLARPRRDEALIAAAGPASNLILALLLSVILRITLPLFSGVASGSWNGTLVMGLFNVLLSTVYINYGLFIFNLIPLPPLDGSHLVFTMLRLDPSLEASLYRYGSFALLGLILLGNFTNLDLLPVGRLVRAMAMGVFHLMGL